LKEIPFEIMEQIVQCFGRCFHYKDPVANFMISSGVPKELVQRYKHEVKFLWSRHVLSELNETDEGRLVQRRILTNLCSLRDLPDKEVTDRNAGLDALRKLKNLAIENELVVKDEKRNIDHRRIQSEQRQKQLQERAKMLEELKKKFNDGLIDSNRQRAGYFLEELLSNLFQLNDIEYRKSYRNPNNTQQIDGHFNFGGFDYLVEAKWRKDMPNSSEIGGFKTKIDSKLESTRGLFVSINGFRSEVIDEYNGRGAKIIFLTGMDLTIILEGRISLYEALKIKIEKAAQEGMTYYALNFID